MLYKRNRKFAILQNNKIEGTSADFKREQEKINVPKCLEIKRKTNAILDGKSFIKETQDEIRKKFGWDKGQEISKRKEG